MLYLQRQEQQQLEAKRQADLAAQQSEIDGLSSQVHLAFWQLTSSPWNEPRFCILDAVNCIKECHV